MSMKELCRDDLLGRFPSYSFLETVIDDTTKVEFRDGSLVTVVQSTKILVDDAYLNIRQNMVSNPYALFCLTTLQRNALTGTEEGTQIIDTSTGSLSYYTGSSWASAGISL